MPFPICLDHAIKVASRVHSLAGPALRAQSPRPHRELYPDGFVYYIYLDGLIKIGHSVSLEYRVSTYPPQAQLLVAEQGTRELEKARHLQFAHLLKARREWFEPCAELWQHISTLREDVQNTAPVVA
jgi:hypothetical protein